MICCGWPSCWVQDNRDAMKEFAGEKTEQPTLRKLEEALKKGQFPRSAEVQTIFVLMGAMLALLFGGLYFLALQHASGNGPLWGIDAGNERDRKALFDTIEQIIRDARSPGDGN